MNISKWIIGTALLLSAPVTYAQAGNYSGGNYSDNSCNYACDPCDPCAVSNPCDLCDIDFCDMKFAAYIDALYWHVCRSDSDHHGDWNWGWRIGGIASWRSWDIGLRYTHFEPDHFEHHVLDVEVGYTCCLPCGGLSIRPFAGAKFGWHNDDFDDDDSDNDTKGLYLGGSARWEICNYSACDRNIPIAFVTRASTGVLYADFDDSDGCFYFPYHDLYVALDFTFCDLCGWDAFFQVGYEVQYWGWREDGGDDVGHLGVGGLVLRFGASF
jgi:hypothetical protein